MKAFLPFIVVAICIGIYFLYISPTLGEIGILSEKKAEYTSVLEKAKELKVKRDVAANAYDNITEEDISRLNKIIPSTFDSVTLANDINTMAAKYGVVLKDLKINDAKAAEVYDEQGNVVDVTQNQPYRTIKFTMKLNGPYEQFLEFLKDVELNLRLVDITNLSANPTASQKSSGGGGNVLDFSLEAQTYSLK